MYRKTVTIGDVAAAAGVSKMTVSNVLSNDAARRRHVSEPTRERVLETVRQMKYRPNVAALSLRRRRTNIIGMYSGYGYLNSNNAFLAAIIGGVQEGCEAHCKDLLLHGVFRGQSVKDIYAELVDGRIDGLVLHTPTNDPLLELLADSMLPVIALTDATPLLPCVVVDDAGGAQMTARYLAERGHHTVVYHSSALRHVSACRREKAFQQAAHTLQMNVLLRCSLDRNNEVHTSEAETDWLAFPPSKRPTAAVCWNDLTACNLLEHCERRALRVPEDLTVIGFDGVMPMRGSSFRLTTVRAPWRQVGKTAIDLLVRRLNDEDIPAETVLPVEWAAGRTG